MPGAARLWVMRHWRGELPLGVSYFGNGILLSLVLLGATRLFFLADIQSAPRTWLAAIALWTGGVLLLGVWQLVGTWRSATRRIRARRMLNRRDVWAQLARVLVALGAVSMLVRTIGNTGPSLYATLPIVFGVDPTAAHTLRIEDDGAAISLVGGIGTGTADEFQALLDAHQAVRRVDLVSNGGRVAEAVVIARLIRARHLATRAPGFCASACTVAFMAGSPRSLGPAGRLGFHRYTFPGLTAAQEETLNETGRRTLLDAGVSTGFIARAFMTPVADVWIPDAATLRAAHVLTEDGG